MSRKGKVQLNYVIVAPADQVAEGDRIFATHAPWMEKTHHREGDKALLVYDVSKVDELSNPFDPSSEKTGNTVFVLAEVYETEAGVADHFEQAQASWPDFPAFVEWLGKCKVYGSPMAPIVNSLW